MGEVRGHGKDNLVIRGRALHRTVVRLTGAALFVGMLTLPLATPVGAADVVAQGWATHSAYGIQISIPSSWAVGYFQDCPVGKSGTLLIGTPLILTDCAEYSASTNLVAMQSSTTQTGAIGGRHLRVHGLAVVSRGASGAITWVLPSEHVTITAQGPQALEVLRTIGRRTEHAVRAPGMLTGREELVALRVVPVTGPVSLSRLDARGATHSVVQAFDGGYSRLLPPGLYRLNGRSGNVDCPPVRATVQSGRTTVAPTIDCQGS